MDEPDFAIKSVPFTVIVKAATRSFRFEHNKPVATQTLLVGDLRDKDEYSSRLEQVVDWISGGLDGMRNSETDIYGVVKLKMPDLSAQIVDMASLTESDTEADNKKAAKAYDEMKKAHIQNTKKVLADAAALADVRVKRALRITHNNLMKQWEAMQQDGKGKFFPSICEAVGAHILAAEIDKAGAKKKEMVDRFVAIANNTVIM